MWTRRLAPIPYPILPIPLNHVPYTQPGGAGAHEEKRKFGEGLAEDPRAQLLAAAMQGTVNLSSRRVRP